MSYQIYAFLPVSAEDPLDTGMQLAYNREERLSVMAQAGYPSAADLAKLLKREWPALQDVQYDRAAIGDEALEFASEDEIQNRLVLVDVESETQIEIGEGVVHVSVPFTLPPAAAQVVFQQIWGCLGELQRELGYVAYDPQIGQILTFSDDLPTALRLYVNRVRNYPGIVEIATVIALPQDENQGLGEVPWYRER